MYVDYQQGSVIWNEWPTYLYHVPPYPRPCICVAWWRRHIYKCRTPLAGCGAHAGMQDSSAFSPFGQRILIFGCMTARRCARCSLGVFQLLWPACYEGRPDVLQAVHECPFLSRNSFALSILNLISKILEAGVIGSFPLPSLCEFRWLAGKCRYTDHTSFIYTFFLQDYFSLQRKSGSFQRWLALKYGTVFFSYDRKPMPFTWHSGLNQGDKRSQRNDPS